MQGTWRAALLRPRALLLLPRLLLLRGWLLLCAALQRHGRRHRLLLLIAAGLRHWQLPLAHRAADVAAVQHAAARKDQGGDFVIWRGLRRGRE